MSEIEGIANMKRDELLEHVDLGALDVVESHSMEDVFGGRLVLGVLSYSFPHATLGGGGFRLTVTMTIFWKN